MGARSVTLGTIVCPGKQFDRTVHRTVPLTPGSYTGSYELQDVRGRFFGNVFTVLVTDSGAAAPAPTSTP